MATRPAKFPRWADAGGLIAEPTEAKKDVGSIVNEKPAAQADNWWKNLSYQWFQFFDALIDAKYYGDGSDGAIVLDGVATFAFASKVGSVYTLTRSIFCTDLTINAGVKLDPGGYIILGQGTLTTNGADAISSNGPNALTSLTVGPVARLGVLVGTSPIGGAPSTTTGGAGGGVLVSFCSAGGPGGAGANAGGAGGTATPPPAYAGDDKILNPGTVGRLIGGGVTGSDYPSSVGAVIPITGGPSGGAGGGDGANPGGAGGCGGGVIAVIFRNIVNSSSADIRVAGGTGGNAAGLTGTNLGGGGGGSGGYAVIACSSISVGVTAALVCPGGTGGTPKGTGIAGTAGPTGILRFFNLGGGTPPTSTAHDEIGNLVVNAGDTSATALFNAAFPSAPPTGGAYTFSYTLSRTDGVLAVPAVLITSTLTDRIVFSILDSFQGVISWRARTT